MFFDPPFRHFADVQIDPTLIYCHYHLRDDSRGADNWLMQYLALIP
jgi:hypothetical protein